MIRILMHGCNGKMGQMITNLMKDDATAQIVAGVDPYDDGHNAYPVFPSIDSCVVKADVIIDFTSAKAVDKLLEYSEKNQVPVVLCTTGLSDEQIERIKEVSKKVAVLKSANMSLGINTLFKLLAEAAKVFNPTGFDI